MDDEAARERVGDALREFIASVVLYNVAVAHKIGIGPSDGQFLTLLGGHGALTPGQLAQLSGLSTGTVTGVIDRLERRGYVRRDRDATDRRKVIVTLVPEATAAMYEHYRAYGEQVDEVLRRRDSTELATIAQFLADLNSGAPPMSTDV